MASVLDWSPEKSNWFKLVRLLIDGGTEAMRIVFQQCHTGKTIQTVLAANTSTLVHLKGKKIINQTQWDKLYPTPPNIPDISNFDITLLSVLLRNICGLIAPSTGWDKEPNASDNSREANIVRIRLFRNDLHAHITETGITTKDFEHYWNKISRILVSFGVGQEEIDQMKAEECLKEVVERVVNEWKLIVSDIERFETMMKKNLEISSETREKVEELQKEVHVIKNILDKRGDDASEDHKNTHQSGEKLHVGQKGSKRPLTNTDEEQKRCKFSEDSQVEQDGSRPQLASGAESNKSDKVLRKIACCDFTAEIKILCDRFVQGTREWVLNQVNQWFNDDESDNRAFIITGEAGMGKSVIAAVVCKRLHEQLAGCHFISYKNDRYNNPKILLQSLAFQISNVLPDYKKALCNQLSRNLGGKNLNELNIESLFTILLKEPLAYVKDRGKNILFVIDGVDESCDWEERSELVDLIATHLHKLPDFFRFLITTRPQKNIVDKFQRLNPLYLKKDDENNKNDLKIFFETKLSSLEIASSQSLITELTSRSDGLMLYAFYIFDCYKKEGNHENFPTDLNDLFKNYFERLEKECTTVLNISEDAFLSLLSAMVAAKEPLPLDFVVGILGVKRETASQRRNVAKVRNCISLLFTIIDSHVSFFHKSVKDWVVNGEYHHFQIVEKRGHDVLAKQCANCFDHLLKGSTDLDPSKLTDVSRYALRNGFFHMIEYDVNSYLNDYLKNLEIICRCVSSQGSQHLFAKKIADMLRMQPENKVADALQEVIVIMDSVSADKFETYACYDFLHQLMTYEIGEVSSEALKLLSRFYPKIPRFEIFEDNLHEKCRRLMLSKGKEVVRSADVHTKLNYVVLCFESGVVKLITLEPLEVIWTKPFAREEISCSCIAFHPIHDKILPGRLDQVLVLADGSLQPGPFSFKTNFSSPLFFTCCCFSPNKTIMITGCSGATYLHVWNLESSSCIDRIELKESALSLSFSTSGNYLAVVADTCQQPSQLAAVTVFDVQKNYKFNKRIVLEGYLNELSEHSNFVSLKGYKSDSWFVSIAGSLCSFDINGLGLTFFSPNVQFIFPASTKRRQSLEATITSQIMPQSVYLDLLRLLSINASNIDWGCKIVHEKLEVILYSNNLELQSTNIVPGNISFDGKFFYQHFQSSRKLSKRNTSDLTSLISNDHENVLAFAVLKNGIFLVTVEENIEMWNVEMSKVLMTIDGKKPLRRKLDEAIKCCESVSDFLVACVGKTKVSFIDSRTLQVMSTTALSENQEVLACSSKHDVAVKNLQEGVLSIIRDNTTVHSLNNAEYIELARFSPHATKIVIFRNNEEDMLSFYELSGSFLKICDFDSDGRTKTICFLDDENLISIVSRVANFQSLIRSDDMQLICLRTKENALITLGRQATSVFYSHEVQTLIINYYNGMFGKYHLHWPQHYRHKVQYRPTALTS